MLLPRTHPWTRTQKVLIIAGALAALAVFVAFAYNFERSHRLPDETVLLGKWELTEPYDANVSFSLHLEPEWAAWHGGTWVRVDAAPQSVAFSDMRWYAGGSYIYMHFTEEPLQIWQIVDIGREELRLRHAKQDYVFRRMSE